MSMCFNLPELCAVDMYREAEELHAQICRQQDSSGNSDINDAEDKLMRLDSLLALFTEY
jgi:hypothetical protein